MKAINKSDFCRKKIALIDKQIVTLLNRRATVAKKLGRLKKETEKPVFSPAREQKILSKIRNSRAKAFPKEAMLAVFNDIIAGCRRLQGLGKVLALGKKNSLLHDAVIGLFGPSQPLQFVEHPKDFVRMIQENRENLGFLPVQEKIPDIVHKFLKKFSLFIITEFRSIPHYVLAGKKPPSSGKPKKILVTPEISADFSNKSQQSGKSGDVTLVPSIETMIEKLEKFPSFVGVLTKNLANHLGLEVFLDLEKSEVNGFQRYFILSSKHEQELFPGIRISLLLENVAKQKQDLYKLPAKIGLPIEQSDIISAGSRIKLSLLTLNFPTQKRMAEEWAARLETGFFKTRLLGIFPVREE